VDITKLYQAEKELLNKDIEFSSYSAINGTSEAILNFLADDGILLRKGYMPIVGKDSANSLISRKKPPNDNELVTNLCLCCQVRRPWFYI
jgi:hypothetical protein